MFFDEIGGFAQQFGVLIFILNLFVLMVLVFLLFFVSNSRKRWNKINDYLGTVTNTVNSVRYGDLTRKIENLDIPNSGNLTESLNRMIETLHDREIMIVEYQNELARQNKLLEEVINSLSDGLLIIDVNGKILRATSRIADWFGVLGKNIIGRQVSDFIDIKNGHPFSQLRGDEISVFNNKELHFIANTVALNIDDKKTRYILIIKNVTDQVELEHLKEDFVATLTHDLKVPIIAETNMIELFLNESFGPISEKQKTAFKNMQASNKELLDLVQTVLETYKVGSLQVSKENIMLKSFIENIIAEMQPIAQKTENNLLFEPKRDIRILADSFQLKRVVKNLIQNAISYGKPKTPIDIFIGEIPNYIVIKIKDHGAGISKEEADKIFNKYYSAAKKFRKIGTGLGLYLARHIVLAHNGDLTVESKEGEYTEFCIKIPA